MNIKNLPQLHPAELEHTQRLAELLKKEIESNGPISFEHFMAQALYHPQYGYYTSGRLKLASHQSSQEAIAASSLAYLERGEAIPLEGDNPSIGMSRVDKGNPAAMSSASAVSGDFITAPELSPWFGRTLALAVSDVLSHCSEKNILEFGAGSGALAAQILESLDDSSVKYFILEVSSDLKELQQQSLSAYADRVVWLEQLPESFVGCVIANEVLDSMPVRLYIYDDEEKLKERHVTLRPTSTSEEETVATQPQNLFTWADEEVTAERLADGIERMPKIAGYSSEFNQQARAWIRSLGEWLKQGAAIIIDYGFPAAEYYHPQRAQGTLMCHFRHHAHPDVLSLPGIQDITAHVDFSAIADEAVKAGLELAGYTSQANFLINCGMLDLLSTLDPEDVENYALHIGPVQKLLSESEMGELFKVMILSKELQGFCPIGFSHADRRSQL